MSHAATKWAFDQPEAFPDMKPGEWAVLMVLADCHNPVNGCFPSQEYISRKTNLTDRTVREQLARLKARALVNWSAERADGRQAANRYMLAFEDGFVAAAGEQPEDSSACTAGNQAQVQPEDFDTSSRKNLPADTNHVREPVNGTVERESAREAESTPSDVVPDPAERKALAKRFRDLARRYEGAVYDKLDVAEALFMALGEADREKAERHVAPFFAALRGPKGGMRYRPPLQDYLGQRRFDLVDAPEASKGAEIDRLRLALVQRFDRAWWWLVWDAFGRVTSVGEAAARTLLERELAKAETTSLAWRIDPERRPEIETAAARLVQVGRDSAEARAWVDHGRRHGLRIPLPDAAPYVWVPSLWPPDDSQGGLIAAADREVVL